MLLKFFITTITFVLNSLHWNLNIVIQCKRELLITVPVCSDLWEAVLI